MDFPETNVCIGNWKGDQPNFGRRVGVVLDPQGGGTSYTFLRGERGNKRQNRKIFLIATKILAFFNKNSIFPPPPAANQLDGVTVVNKL